MPPRKPRVDEAESGERLKQFNLRLPGCKIRAMGYLARAQGFRSASAWLADLCERTVVERADEVAAAMDDRAEKLWAESNDLRIEAEELRKQSERFQNEYMAE